MRNAGPEAERIAESAAHLRDSMYRGPLRLVPTLKDHFGVIRKGPSTVYYETASLEFARAVARRGSLRSEVTGRIYSRPCARRGLRKGGHEKWQMNDWDWCCLR